MSLFSTNTDFCPRCGSVLPLPGRGDVICYVCQHTIDVKEFHGKKIISRIPFNDEKKIFMNKKNKTSDSDASGPLVDRKCARCGHEGMTYATLQTRSADEGQTVFYTCPKCRFQENENS